MLELLMQGTIFLWVIFFSSIVAVGVTLERWQAMRRVPPKAGGLIEARASMCLAMSGSIDNHCPMSGVIISPSGGR